MELLIHIHKLMVCLHHQLEYSAVDNGNAFTGNIDEIAIYNRALSASEIQSHYLAKFGITNPSSYAAKVVLSGPSNYWRLNELSGTVANDMVGYANGTISGGVVFLGQSGSTFDGKAINLMNGGNITLRLIYLFLSLYY